MCGGGDGVFNQKFCPSFIIFSSEQAFDSQPTNLLVLPKKHTQTLTISLWKVEERCVPLNYLS